MIHFEPDDYEELGYGPSVLESLQEACALRTVGREKAARVAVAPQLRVKNWEVLFAVVRTVRDERDAARNEKKKAYLREYGKKHRPLIRVQDAARQRRYRLERKALGYPADSRTERYQADPAYREKIRAASRARYHQRKEAARAEIR